MLLGAVSMPRFGGDHGSVLQRSPWKQSKGGSQLTEGLTPGPAPEHTARFVVCGEETGGAPLESRPWWVHRETLLLRDRWEAW